jgi:hypothetical protein
MWRWNPQTLLDRLHLDGVAWFGAGLGAAGAAVVGYQLLLASSMAAANPPPRPTALPLRAEVVGEVGQPGAYDLPPTARIEDALGAAGGLTAQADDSRLNLAARVTDGQRIFVPRMAQSPTSRPTPSPWPTRTPTALRPPPPTRTPWATRTPWPTRPPFPTRTPTPLAADSAAAVLGDPVAVVRSVATLVAVTRDELRQVMPTPASRD